jgi:hypothetical protein
MYFKRDRLHYAHIHQHLHCALSLRRHSNRDEAHSATPGFDSPLDGTLPAVRWRRCVLRCDLVFRERVHHTRLSAPTLIRQHTFQSAECAFAPLSGGNASITWDLVGTTSDSSQIHTLNVPNIERICTLLNAHCTTLACCRPPCRSRQAAAAGHSPDEQGPDTQDTPGGEQQGRDQHGSCASHAAPMPLHTHHAMRGMHSCTASSTVLKISCETLSDVLVNIPRLMRVCTCCCLLQPRLTRKSWDRKMPKRALLTAGTGKGSPAVLLLLRANQDSVVAWQQHQHHQQQPCLLWPAALHRAQQHLSG